MIMLGMINLMSAVLKHNPEFKHQPVGQQFVEKVGVVMMMMKKVMVVFMVIMIKHYEDDI